MTTLRQSTQHETRTSIVSVSFFESVTDAFVYNRNFGDITTASHVINNVPKAVPYQNGGTLLRWAAAPIPRSWWPDKPIVNVGPIIGITIYGTAVGGVPPGFVGDSYLNFGFLGVSIGSILLGWLLGSFEQVRSRITFTNPAVAILYGSVAFQFGIAAIGKGIGAAMYGGVAALVPVVLSLMFVGGIQRGGRGRRVAGTHSATTVSF
jgi:hypothetical protein